MDLRGASDIEAVRSGKSECNEKEVKGTGLKSIQINDKAVNYVTQRH